MTESRQTNPRPTRTSAHGLAVAFAIACVAFAVLLLPAAPAAALTYVVDRSDDSAAADNCVDANANDCTLRGAILTANSTSDPDTIEFDGSVSEVLIDAPLPSPANGGLPGRTVAIDGGGDVSVRGSAAYEAAPACTETDPALMSWAIDLTDAAAFGSTIRRLMFRDVCNRAIKSNLAPPSIQVGPRRANGTLPISGAANGAVDIFGASSSVDDQEADSYVASVSAAGGYAYVPPLEPAPGAMFTATVSGTTTSNFARRVAVPADIASPTLVNAVAVTNSRVRLDFNEQLGAGSVVPGAFGLGMANKERAITAATASGNSVFLDASPGWAAGEAGNTQLTGNGRVTDAVGNEVIGVPGATVFGGPGELDAPAISSYRLQPNKLCQKATVACKRGTTYVLITLNKPCRVIFHVMRGTRRQRRLVTFVKRLGAGRNKFKFTASVSGRRLPASTMTLRATAQDAARTLSVPTDTLFRVVKHRRDL